MRSDGGDSSLLLSPEAPYPLAGGGPARTASLLNYLASRSKVHLVTFAEEGSANPECALPRGLVDRITTIALPHHGRDRFSRGARNARRLLQRRLPLMDRFGGAHALRRVDLATSQGRYRVAVVEHFWCAQYVDLLRSRADHVVLNLHNVESILHGACAESEPWPHSIGHRLFRRTAARLERRLLAEFDLVLTASAEDAARVRDLCPDARTAVYPNAIPLRSAPAVDADDSIAFSGNLAYHPNVTAIRFFLAKVWPILRRQRPNLVWRLIGKNHEGVRDMVAGDPRILLTGPVGDAIAEIARSRLAVVPLLAGSGTRVKIMEAWAAARPVISSRIGAEGLPARNGENLVFAEQPDDWTAQVIGLLDNEAERARLGAGGREAYERYCCWPAAWKTIDGHFGRFLDPLASTT